jgi:hypothetical protein
MMYVEFTELIVNGIQQGKTRRIVINLGEVISFREGPHNSGCVLDTRRGDVHVKETYNQVKELFNNKNGVAPVLMPIESWMENISNPVIGNFYRKV